MALGSTSVGHHTTSIQMNFNQDMSKVHPDKRDGVYLRYASVFMDVIDKSNVAGFNSWLHRVFKHGTGKTFGRGTAPEGVTEASSPATFTATPPSPVGAITTPSATATSTKWCSCCGKHGHTFMHEQAHIEEHIQTVMHEQTGCDGI